MGNFEVLAPRLCAFPNGATAKVGVAGREQAGPSQHPPALFTDFGCFALGVPRHASAATTDIAAFLRALSDGCQP